MSDPNGVSASDPSSVHASPHPLQTPPPARATVPSSPPAFGRSSIDTTQYRECDDINFADPAAKAASAVTYVTDHGNLRTVDAYAVGARFAATRQLHGYSLMFADLAAFLAAVFPNVRSVPSPGHNCAMFCGLCTGATRKFMCVGSCVNPCPHGDLSAEQRPTVAMGNLFVRLGREPVSKECGTEDAVWRQRLREASASHPRPGVLTMLNPWAPADSGGSLYEMLFPSVNPNAPWYRQERNSALVAQLQVDVAVVLREFYMGILENLPEPGDGELCADFRIWHLRTCGLPLGVSAEDVRGATANIME